MAIEKPSNDIVRIGFNAAFKLAISAWDDHSCRPQVGHDDGTHEVVFSGLGCFQNKVYLVTDSLHPGKALWFRTAVNQDLSTGPLAGSLVCLLHTTCFAYFACVLH